MAPPNLTWREIVQGATVQPDILKQTEVIRNVQNILSTNASVASSLGQPFLSQITLIYLDMLNMYRCAPLLSQSSPCPKLHLSIPSDHPWCWVIDSRQDTPSAGCRGL